MHLCLPTAHAPWKTLKFDVENMLGGGVLSMDVFWHLIDKERPLVSLNEDILNDQTKKCHARRFFFCILSSNLDKNTFNHVHFFAYFPRQNLCSPNIKLSRNNESFGNVGKYILHQVLQLLIERFWILHTLKAFPREVQKYIQFWNSISWWDFVFGWWRKLWVC